MMRAALPGDDYIRPTGVIDDGIVIYVTFYPEGGGDSKDFRFDRMHGCRSLQLAFARGFARVTGPGGTRRTAESARTVYNHARTILRLLNDGAVGPENASQLKSAHLAALRMQRSRYSLGLLQSWRVLLRGEESLSTSFREALYAPLPAGIEKSKVTAYSDKEFRDIRRAARTQVRRALLRVRAAEEDLEAWKVRQVVRYTGNPARAALLEQIASAGDVPRDSRGAVRHNQDDLGAGQAARDLFPSFTDVAALAVLLICTTGHNLSTVRQLSSHHLRADDQLNETPVAIVGASKPRRGPGSSEMDLAFVGERPTFPKKIDLNSEFGLLQVAEHMCHRARRFAKSDLLLIAFSTKGPNAPKPFRALPQGVFDQLVLQDRNGDALPRIDARRLRRYHLLRNQKPVAHSAATLHNSYLIREPAGLRENQELVNTTLHDEVTRIRATSAVIALDEQELAAIAENPGPVALRMAVSEEQLRLIVEGRLDTVATACVDNLHSPVSRSGAPCTASFLLCLGCPNARSEPRHVPVQALLSQQLHVRRASMSDTEWNLRYRVADEQLSDLLERQRVDVAGRARQATPDQARLITQLLDGKLDLR